MGSKIIPGVYPEVLLNGAGIPVQDDALDVIGIIGTFSRGPLQTPTSVANLAQAMLLFGDLDNTQNPNFLTGMWAVKMAMDQGASRVVILRVGNAATASLDLKDDIVGNILNAASTLVNPEAIGAGVVVELASTTGFAIGQKVIIDRGGGNEEVTTITAVNPGVSITVNLANNHLAAETCELVIQAGAGAVIPMSANPLAAGFLIGQQVILNETQPNEETVTITNVSATAITATTTQDHYANETVEQTAVVATLSGPTPGSFANLYTVAVAAGSQPNTVKLTITGDGKQEVWDNLTMTPGTARYLVDFLNNTSVLVRAAAGASPNLPAVMASTPLSGGTNGNVTTDADYIGSAVPTPTGIQAFVGVNVNILNCAGQASAAVHTALDVHCKAMNDRIAVVGGAINEDKATTLARAAALASDRIVLAYPGVKVFDQLANATVTMSSAYASATVAGRIGTLDPYKSPSNKQVIGILGMEKDINDADLADLIQGGVVVTTVKGRLGFRLRDGLTTTISFPFNQINIRRLFDQIVRGVTESNQDLVSEPNNDETRHALEQGITDFMEKLKGQGAIQKFYVNVYSSEADQKAGFLYADIGIFPTYAADFIVIRIKPNDTGSFDSSVVSGQ